jgi:putative redox protein
MAQAKVEAKHIDNMAYQMELDGFNLILDASEENGGKNLGPRPKKLLLAGLIGCTGMDVASILKKMQVEPEDFNITATAETADEHPKVYTQIHLTYRFIGKSLPKDKIERAVSLSQERYCAVSAMLQKAAPVSYDIVIEET